ncbi:hypothetical protein EJ04DRAFT_526638 [Polyplosphaeria fusca]|uniref:Uncharacterized protein n=1 Tax=Polyplosphaeria fusca TaxID=682080 RepID=A0A9P4QNN6_9PLEO|nr:hypothetical protein EJ04DRAFT_526638 [Polyplosphaeria fusca]
MASPYCLRHLSNMMVVLFFGPLLRYKRLVSGKNKKRLSKSSYSFRKKKEKAQLLEEKRHMRAIAKEARKQKQQQKAAKREEEKIARAAQKQLQAATKLAQKGVRKISKRVAQVSKPTDVDAASVDDAGPVATQSSRGQKINLPERYK